MEPLFSGIPLQVITVSMTVNAPATIMLAFYAVAAERQRIPSEKPGGTIQADILKEWIAQREWCWVGGMSLRFSVLTALRFHSRFVMMQRLDPGYPDR